MFSLTLTFRDPETFHIFHQVFVGDIKSAETADFDSIGRLDQRRVVSRSRTIPRSSPKLLIIDHLKVPGVVLLVRGLVGDHRKFPPPQRAGTLLGRRRSE
jgi:hypothetical protein